MVHHNTFLLTLRAFHGSRSYRTATHSWGANRTRSYLKLIDFWSVTLYLSNGSLELNTTFCCHYLHIYSCLCKKFGLIAACQKTFLASVTRLPKKEALSLPGCYAVLGMKSVLIAPHTRSAKVSLSTTRATFVLTILAKEKDPCEYIMRKAYL